jgi:twinkle protein
MSKLILSKLPCPNQSCSSTDAFHIYEDDGLFNGYCFSCTEFFKDRVCREIISDELLTNVHEHGIINSNTIEHTIGIPTGKSIHLPTKENIDSNTYSNPKGVPMDKPYRGLTLKTLEKFNVSGDGKNVYYDYGDGVVKRRVIATKEFSSSPAGRLQSRPLFGVSLFPKSSAKIITITEGEDDAMSVWQMMGDYPVVSLKSGSSVAKDIAANLEYLNSFEQINLCFDNDKVGKKATEVAAQMFPPDKVRVVTLDRFKDANDYLTNNAEKEFARHWWNASKYRPENIVSSHARVREILEEPDAEIIADYPFPSLNEMTFGLRAGECVLWKAQEKIGKTEIIRCIEQHLLKTTDHNIGIIHLEESESRSIKGFASYVLEAPVHLPTNTFTNDEIFEAYCKLTKRDDRVHFYRHFGSDDPDTILNACRYLATACGCRVIFLDHISMVVSGHKDEGDERRKLDRISTELATQARELNYNLQFISHVNDQGQTRGSRYLPKVADLVIDLERDKQDPCPIKKNTTKLTIVDNRFAGMSGVCCDVYFNPETFTINELSEEELSERVETSAPF